MILTLDLIKLKNLELSINDYLILLLIYNKLHNITIDYTPRNVEYLSLADRGYISIEGSNISLTDKGMTALEYEEKSTNKRNYQKLAEEIRNVFPKGLKDGKYPWRATIKSLEEKLKKLDKSFGLDKYSDDIILKAVSSYVSRFERDPSGMRISLYFLLKDNSSDLMAYLELEEEQERKSFIKKI